ncbi:MAG: ATP-binding cassette domain-containing protein [Flavobacteriales bacterium]|nr:ATP-binding cassette domain-containing protein [Flavobacteriales bacterium]
MEYLLQAENIVKKFATHVALDGVSISVPKGHIFGLLGPNGAGKTTLIRIINQITGPDSGSVLFDGQPLNSNHVADIGYLPEERGLYKKMKVGEQALYLAQLKGMSKSEAQNKLNHWFKKFEIEGWWNKKVEELSKGMQQKIQFIITVLHEPKLLILDEPFSGFDPINTNLIKQEILELKEKGSTIIFSTHNMSSVEEICDHIALINQSKKILDGPINEIRDAYSSNLFELQFKGNMIAFTNALWTGYELLEQEEKGGINKVKIKKISKQSTNNLLEAIIPHVEVVSLNEILPSMNDIFIEKVNEINQPQKEVI